MSLDPCIYFLFPQFFEDKATEHLLGDGIEPKHLNDDKIGRVMDKLYQIGVSGIFLVQRHRRRLAEPEPQAKRLSPREERAALREKLGLPPY